MEMHLIFLGSADHDNHLLFYLSVIPGQTGLAAALSCTFDGFQSCLVSDSALRKHILRRLGVPAVAALAQAQRHTTTLDIKTNSVILSILDAVLGSLYYIVTVYDCLSV